MGTVGGGDILKHIGSGTGKEVSELDTKLIKLFEMVPIVKFLIVVLLLVIMVIAVLRLFNIKSILKKKGIKNELNAVDEVRKRDAAIIRANNLIRMITELVESTPFSMNKLYNEYWQYNIDRVGIKIPGGYRNMRAEEFNAVVKVASAILMGLSLLIMVLFNFVLGWVLVIFILIMSGYMPMMVVRQVVKDKDSEIRSNFSDFYLSIHHTLISGASTPLSSLMRSYGRTTTSKEMDRLVDTCIHYIDTYGEYEATRYITKDYREIPEIGKLMRLIRQSQEGGSIHSELIGFRTEVINEKRYSMKKRSERLVRKAKMSFNILMPILIQAILSAMSIYFSDFALIKGLLG